MQHGIYYAYWEKEWGADYRYYVEKAAKLGFDILEIAAGHLPEYSTEQISELKKSAEENKIRLTAGYGPVPEHNIASADDRIKKKALDFYKSLFEVMEKLDITLIGGGIYSYWPVDYSKLIDKEGDWKRSVEGIQELADIAKDYHICLCMEVLNRFEGYLLNTAKEGVMFVQEVNRDNVKVMLDTFHMNIEETDLGEAIRTAGPLLGHFHTGECNRMIPGQGRMPWKEIHDALQEIQYDQAVVMEPFVQRGGTVGTDIRVWREILPVCNERQLDNDAAEGVKFQRRMLEWK